MPQHDLTRLSPLDFEELVRDLLAAEWQLPVESFSPGADGGIDLRATKHENGTDSLIVVQCKHYARSPYRTLLRAARSEADRLTTMTPTPDRYIFATGQQLTPANKRQISNVFTPWVRTPSDIVGGGDIENLLARHPEIERRHIKLWLTNTAVLEQVLHAGLFNRSRIHLEELASRARLFVPHPALAEIRRVLSEERVCVLSGAPGVGKTSMADLLALEYMSDGFEVLYVQDAFEAFSAATDDSRRQFFVYDDFLGTVHLGDGASNSADAGLADFVRYVHRTANKRMVLTTREYLFRRAMEQSEILERESGGLNKTVIEISAYTRLQRAYILYNHLYWADGLNEEDLNDLLVDRNWARVIDHPNYNPRLVETAVRMLRRGQ